ncbi:pre T-cell antigen receptor alpha-like [Conger conger]|uniref:pre T-cell antigen receptor alpha-like n=1 Tax=Conger conger TaxID=82655 RepID=UPI002A5A1E9B|nr:pre T-cell antigen receptor alpha-like [Conger conger]
MILCLLALHLMALAVEAEVFATLGPPFHLPREGGSRTILVCLVSHPTRGDMLITWLSSSAGGSHSITDSVAQEEDGTHSAISVISVPTDQWDSYTCFITHSNPAVVTQRRYSHFLEEEHNRSCYEDAPNVILTQSDAVFILALRILLLKITIFNLLMTTNAVIK